MSVCAVVWCDRVAKARGLCIRCYAKYKRGLGPNDTRRYTSRETKKRVRSEATQRRVAGEGIADIAVSLGVNESTMGKWFREWGVQPASGKYGRSLAQNKWKRWTRDEAVIAYTRTDLSIAERAGILKRSYTAVAGFICDYRQREGDPWGIKEDH